MEEVDQNKQHPDEYWRNNLSQKEYEALRLGKMEEPNTGKYVHTNASGRYYCRGCGTYLFSSRDKTNDGSGYATFKLDGEDEGVRLDRSYTQTGDEKTTPTCRACGGKLGEAADVELRSADNLEQGTQERLIHINSSTVSLKKNFSLRNYPFAYLIIIASIIGGALFAWSWAGGLFGTAQHENINETINLWVGDSEIFAKTIYIENLNPEEQSFVFGEGVLFVVLPKKENAPKLTLPRDAVDVIWLDNNFTVLKKDTGLYSEVGEVLKYEDGSDYALISNVGYFSDTTVTPGTEVIVVNKAQLF